MYAPLLRTVSAAGTLGDVCCRSRNAVKMLDCTVTLRTSGSIFSSGLQGKAGFPVNQGGVLCLSAAPWCWEEAHRLFNSQPIFCPSQHFIPVLKLSSGPTLSLSDTDTSPRRRQQYQKTHFQYEQQIISD